MSRHNFYQLLRFMTSGGTATLVHFMTMGVLVYSGTEPSIATAIGAIAGAILNYLLQYYFAFRSSRRHSLSLISYTAASGLAWISNLILFILFHDFIELNVVFAQLSATAVVTIQNYFVYNKLVFHS